MTDVKVSPTIQLFQAILDFILIYVIYIMKYRVFFNWYPLKKLKYGKPRLGESTLT